MSFNLKFGVTGNVQYRAFASSDNVKGKRPTGTQIRAALKRMNLPQSGEGDPRCSFCGKHQREVKTLIAGAAVFICDECVGLCHDMLRDDQRP